jgi:GNAT superfamily N-acetyltransferase
MTSSTTHQQITSRPIRDEEDFWRIYRLITRAFSITPIAWNWDIRRWEGKHFYDEAPDWLRQWAGRIQVWETADGDIVGAVHPEGKSDAYLELHPDYRRLENEMFAWAEEHLSAPSGDSLQRCLYVYAWEYDALRRRLLSERGYEKLDEYGVVRRLRFGGWSLPPRPPLAEGYTLRTTNPDDLADCQRIADLLNAAFRRDFHNAAEYQNFTRLAPSFRNELDLVAVAPDGSFAAYVAMPYEEPNREGIFEPVCTHPDHRQKGLAKALMIEALHRVRALGAATATVETGDMAPANALYDSIGFSEVYYGYTWRKTL